MHDLISSDTDATRARISRLLAPVAIAIAVIAADWSFLLTKLPIYLNVLDNLFSYYPMWYYFIEGLRHGVVYFYQPFLWAGTRVLGDPDFKINVVQIVTGLLLGPDAAYRASNYMLIVERLTGSLGMYALIGMVCPRLNQIARGLLALTYVFSLSYAYYQSYHNLSIPLATTPCILWLLADRRLPTFPAFCGLAVLFYVMFSYAQLQIDIYGDWIILSFIAFWIPRPEKLRAFLLLVAAGTAGLALSAYFVLPLFDTLYLSDPSSGRVASTLADVGDKYVPAFFLIRLVAPFLFGPPDWWPVWRDGWTLLETFSAFQGAAITLLVWFGLLSNRVPLYFRGLYMFLIITVTTGPGLKLLYFMNLGTGVNYGRQTVFLALAAPLIAAFVLQAIQESQRVAGWLAAWMSIGAAVLLTFYIIGVPKRFVTYVYAQALTEFPHADVKAADALAYYGAHAVDLQHSLAQPALFAAVGALAAFAAVAAPAFRARLCTIAPTAAALMICVLGLTDTTIVYLASRNHPRPNEISKPPTYAMHHPLEDAMIADGLQVLNGPIEQRLHIDIYFGEQWSGVTQTLHLVGGTPQQNRFRTMPNFLAANHIPVTGGYSSVIPSATRFTEMIFGSPSGHGIYQRAISERTDLRPSMLEAFAVKWVLRHQPAITANIEGGAPDKPNDPWEERFEKSSTLIYQDDAYRLYEYHDARPAIDIPDRIAFGPNPVTTLESFEAPDRLWIATAALPATAVAGLSADLRRHLVTENGLQVIHQSGKILRTDGQAGRWTNIVAETDQPAILLLGVKDDPWWHAWVNGHPVPLIRANGVFSAVAIPAGQSAIEVRLRPISAWLGLAITGLTALAMLAGATCKVMFRRGQRSASLAAKLSQPSSG